MPSETMKASTGAVRSCAILDLVRQHYAGQYIRKIERDRHGYEVKLTSGLELKFDRNGRFRKID